MIAKVAIAPECFDNSTEPKSLTGVLLDVLNSGIVLSDFHKKDKWSALINELYKDYLDPKYRNKILVLMKTLKNKGKIVRLSDFGETIDSEKKWCDAAIANAKEGNINLITIGKKSIEVCIEKACDKCHHIDDVNISDEWVELKRNDAILHKTQTEVNDVLKTFLPYSKTLKIIDPYFNESGKCKDSIEIFAKHFRNRGALGYIRSTIEIHTTNVKDRNIDLSTFKIRMQRMLEGIENEGKHTFKIFIWKDNSPEDKFHDRMILTNIAGIKSTHSFDVKENSRQEVTWSLLSNKSYEVHLNNFSEEDAKFILEDTITVSRIQ